MANINMKKGTEAAKANKTLKRRGGFIWNFLDNTNEETEKKPGDPNFLFLPFFQRDNLQHPGKHRPYTRELNDLTDLEILLLVHKRKDTCVRS